LGSDGAVCDVDSAAVVHGLFLDDALGRGTQVENVFARSVEEVWIRERKSPTAGVGHVEGDARVGPAVCLDKMPTVVSIFENVCYRAPFAVNRPTRVMPPLIELPATINTKLELTLLTLVGTVLLCATASPESIPPLVLINRTRVESTM